MGKIIDLTGQKFGFLTVIKQNGRDNNNKIMWLCKCDCGKEKTVRGNDLRAGKTKSCGCQRTKKIIKGRQEYAQKQRNNPGFYKDLTNKVFGRLKVLEFDKDTTIKKHLETSQKTSWWKCQCECGNIVSIPASTLTSGKTRSCGCLQKEKASINMKTTQKLGAQARFIDLTGQTFYNLTVLKRADKNTNSNKPKWICQCKCGNIIEVPGNTLKRGETKSCGCIGRSLGQDIIRNLLIANNIPFSQEVKFDDLKDKSYLRFDFSILDKNKNIIKLIEYDGRQHTDPTSIWHTEQVIKHDQMKNDYCKKNNIPLLRISYKDIDKINLDYLLNQITFE